MEIILAQHFGMCFGVRDAIAQAEELALNGPLTILGELVHNPLVHERLRRQGVAEGSLNTPVNAGGSVMITAHGTSDAKRAEWRSRGLPVADATCPLVRYAHNQLRALVIGGYFPVVIGRRGHIEVEGLTGDFADAFVVGTADDVLRLPEKPRYGIISQTTQPIDFVLALVDHVRLRFPAAETRFVDTVCKPTKDRQTALHDLLNKVELVVVVGGRHSNNTRQLVNTCVASGRRAVHVERADELRARDFVGVERVGLTAGTSTLSETVEAVRLRLAFFAAQSKHGAEERSIC